MKYVADDSTMFWAVGPNSGVIAEHVEFCGKEVEMAIPFEGVNSGEVPSFFFLFYSCFLTNLLMLYTFIFQRECLIFYLVKKIFHRVLTCL